MSFPNMPTPATEDTVNGRHELDMLGSKIDATFNSWRERTQARHLALRFRLSTTWASTVAPFVFGEVRK